MSGLEHVEATPELLRMMVSPLTGEETAWKAAPDRFSIAEVLAHLAHVEHHEAGRLRAWSAEEEPHIASYDTDALVAARAYSGRPAREALEDFTRQRRANLATVRSLSPAVVARRALHLVVGPITLVELTAEWSAHDLGHIRQVAEIIRAVRYYPRLGPFDRFYRLQP